MVHGAGVSLQRQWRTATTSTCTPTRRNSAAARASKRWMTAHLAPASPRRSATAGVAAVPADVDLLGDALRHEVVADSTRPRPRTTARRASPALVTQQCRRTPAQGSHRMRRQRRDLCGTRSRGAVRGACAGCTRRRARRSGRRVFSVNAGAAMAVAVLATMRCGAPTCRSRRIFLPERLAYMAARARASAM